MTEQQQAACAELARRIGWREGSASGVWFSPSNAPEICVYNEAPDYFTDPAASRELIVWLAKQERSIQREFVFALREATDEVDLCYELRLLTAEPSVIARAACKALGVEVSE